MMFLKFDNDYRNSFEKLHPFSFLKCSPLRVEEEEEEEEDEIEELKEKQKKLREEMEKKVQNDKKEQSDKQSCLN